MVQGVGRKVGALLLLSALTMGPAWSARREKDQAQEQARREKGERVPRSTVESSTHAPSEQAQVEQCRGTIKSWMRCDAIAAQAALDQAEDADSQVRLAWWQFSFGAFTLLVAIAAAWFARSAAVHAKSSADAAVDQVKLSRQTSERQLRAYLACQNIEVNDFEIGQRPVFRFNLWNSGSTPAYEVVQWSGAWPVENAETFKVHFERQTASRSVISPGQDVWSFIGPGNDSSLSDLGTLIYALRHGSLVMVVAGIVSYKDAFGRRHRSTFKTVLDTRLIKDGTGRLVDCRKGNKAN